MSYSVVELDGRIAAAIGLPVRRFPVRSDQVEAIIGGARFRLDRLVDEVDVVVSELDADDQNRAAASIARLAVVVAMDLDAEGQTERALHYAVLAQEWAPSSAEAIALVAVLSHGVGDLDTAVEHYLRVLRLDPDGAWVGLRSLAARAASTAGDSDLAVRFIEPAATAAQTTEAFWALVSRLRSEAALRAHRSEAFVIPAEGAAWKTAPSVDAPDLQWLVGGRVMCVDEELDGWLHVRDVDGQRGYVKS